MGRDRVGSWTQILKGAVNFSGSVRDLFVPCEVRFYMLTKIFYVIAKGNMGFIKRRGVWLREWVILTLVADPMMIAWVLVGLGFKVVLKVYIYHILKLTY